MFINHKATVEEIIKGDEMTKYQAKESGRIQIRFYEYSV
jgi:hypothetical protein